MTIKGGAGPFEAAVIAVVLDQITREENRARSAPAADRRLSAWLRALDEEEYDLPRELVDPARP